MLSISSSPTQNRVSFAALGRHIFMELLNVTYKLEELWKSK